MVEVDIDSSNCKGCGVCVDICPRDVFELSQKPKTKDAENTSVATMEEACIMCLACLEACEEDCISISDSSSDMII